MPPVKVKPAKVKGMKVKKGDTVQVITGKDRGKQGRVLEARPKELRVVVENLNVVKRHVKPKPMRDTSRMGGSAMIPGRRAREGRADPDLQRDARVPDLQARDAHRHTAPRKCAASMVHIRVCKRADCGQEIDR